MSRFLSYADWQCGHDELRHARSMADVNAWFAQPCTGTVETAAAPFWRLLPDGVRTIVVRRPVGDVLDSLSRLGFAADPQIVRRMDAKLDQIEARVPSVLSVQFSDLASEEGCAMVFEHCLPYVHDHGWWETMAALNLQINFGHMLRHYAAYRPQLEKFAGQAKHTAIAAMRCPPRAIDGMTIQHEPFDVWYRDAVPLFREHMLQTGQAIDDYTRKNIPLLRLIDELGCMQVTTARCNGRMFGYLMTVLSPSLDAPDVLSAMNLPFFASTDTPGLGMKLQRASIDGLRARGVGEIFMRAGTRGSGPRLGVMYRRLGAVPDGELFKLELKAA